MLKSECEKKPVILTIRGSVFESFYLLRLKFFTDSNKRKRYALDSIPFFIKCFKSLLRAKALQGRNDVFTIRCDAEVATGRHVFAHFFHHLIALFYILGLGNAFATFGFFNAGHIYFRRYFHRFVNGAAFIHIQLQNQPGQLALKNRSRRYRCFNVNQAVTLPYRAVPGVSFRHFPYS